MKKKIKSFLILFLTIFCFQTACFASIFNDEIVADNGKTIPCHVISVLDGFIEYNSNGSKYKFTRENQSAIFSDYVDVRTKLGKNGITSRYTGTIIYKDYFNLVMRKDGNIVEIPFYRVRQIGIYKP